MDELTLTQRRGGQVLWQMLGFQPMVRGPAGDGNQGSFACSWALKTNEASPQTDEVYRHSMS